MAKPGYYEILEIDRETSQAEVKRAYRRLARKYHPDVNPGDGAAAKRFKLIKKAYDVLADPLSRDDYDQKLSTTSASEPIEEPYTTADNSYGGTANGGVGAVAEDIFNSEGDDLYDVSSVMPREYAPPEEAVPTPGVDLRYDLEITFEDAAFGLETEVEVPYFYVCKSCSGTGYDPGSPPQSCPKCYGRGEIEITRETPYGPQLSVSICDECNGRGTTLGILCDQCNGSGHQQTFERILVKIPPGVDNGSRLRIRGKGEPGIAGGAAGDLYVIIHVREHELFERHGEEILCETTISFAQAVLGAEIEVPTLEGSAKMKIPPGTQTGTIFRLRGKGIYQTSRGSRGDQHVKVTIVTPSNLNEKQRLLLRKFAGALGENV